MDIRLGLKQKVLLVWLCFSSVTSFVTVALVPTNLFAASLRIFFWVMLLLNLPVWAIVFGWHLLEQTHSNPWNLFILFALFINYVTAFLVWSTWRNSYAAYFILIATSILAAVVLNDISKTIVFGGVCVIASGLASVIFMMLPLLVYGAPVEQMNLGLLLYISDVFWKLIIVVPICLLTGLVSSILADRISQRQNAQMT